MNVPEDRSYTESHEWVLVEGSIATIGITDFAQDQLSDLTFVELPTVGDSVAAEDEVAVVESVKAASDVYAPVSGTICDVNAALADKPETLNEDPFGAGWLFKVELSNTAELDDLMDAATYAQSMPDDD